MKSKLIAVLAILSTVTLGFSSPAQAGQITNNSYQDSSPQIKNNYLVWQSYADGDWEVFLYDIAKRETIQITNNGYGDVSPQTDGSYVVWLGFSNSGGEIFLYDIASEMTTPITNDTNVDSPPQIANSLVVWASQEVTTSVEPGDIFLYDIVGTTTTSLSASVDPAGTLDDSSPQINNENVIWVQKDDLGTTLFMYDLPSGPSHEAPEGFVWEDSPQTDGDLTVYSRVIGNDREIFVRKSSLSTYKQLTENDIQDEYPRVSGNNIAWVGGKGQDSEIYLAFYGPSICAIREQLSGKQGLYIYNPPPGLDGQTEPPVATDRHFGNSNQGSNIIAMACLDIDGNGSDEIAVIRQRSGGKQRLEIYDPPEAVGGDTGDPIVSDLSFGNLNTDSNNIAMTGVDIDGDGTDEIAVIREKQTGKQGLFIFTPPQTVGGETGGAIATDRSFGFSGTGRNIIAITGLQFDIDAPDEIAVIMERTSGRQRLEIYDAPQTVGGETGDPIASDLTFGNSTTNKNNIALTSVDVLSDGIDEIAVVRQKTSGRQRLEIYDAPQTVGGETGSPIGSDVSFGTAGTDIYTIFISGMKF